MFGWIQITEEEAMQLDMQKIVPANCGYTYNHPETREKMREYHVDTYNLFQGRMNAQTPFGGNRSVRYREDRMLIIWGHDEAM
jgi:hypothetical protein